MLKKILLIAAALLLIIIGAFEIFIFRSTGGQQYDNYPYEPDTPAPDLHMGTFVSEHGTLTFDGDGLVVDYDFDDYLSAWTGLPAGENRAEYLFLSGDLPPHGSVPVRYDVAHELSLNVLSTQAVIQLGIAAGDGSTASVGVNMVTPERIPFLFRDENGKWFTVMFNKK